VRLVAGILALAGVGGDLLRGGGPALLEVSAGLILALAGYAALYRLWGTRRLRHTNAWIGTVIVLAPFGLLQLLPLPSGIQTGFGLYVAVSLVLAAGIAYGGCEVATIPSLIVRKRLVVYCVYNAVDAAERSLSGDLNEPGRVLAAALALLVGVYFLFVHHVLSALNWHDPVPPGAALVLVVPAALLGLRSLSAGLVKFRLTPSAQVDAVGSLALLGMAFGLAGIVPTDILWGSVMALAFLVALGRTAARRLRGRPSGA